MYNVHFYVTSLPLVCVCACDYSDYSPLLEALGLFFQIRDDYANLSSQEVSFSASLNFLE